jgi:hypothetical protein
MVERQLADLLIQSGLERNVDIETIVSELAALTLPSFVNAEAFRTSLVDMLETRLRQQTDERIRRLRQQLEVSSHSDGRIQPQVQPDAEEPITMHEPEPVRDEHIVAAVEPARAVEPLDIPEDATMVWKSRDRE